MWKLFNRKLAAVALVLVMCTGPALRADSDNIDQALYEVVPVLMNKMKQMDIHNVGVAPFRLKYRGKEKVVGALIQSNMAQRMEQAILSVWDEDHPIGVVTGFREQVLSKNFQRVC